MQSGMRLAGVVWLVAATGCAADAVRLQEKQGGVRIAVGPYLQMPARDVLAVCWGADRPAPGEVRLKRVGLVMLRQQFITSKALGRDALQKVKLSTLAPGVAYDYVVAAGDSVGPRYRFRVPDPDAESTRFAVYGSSHSDPQGHQDLARSVARLGPDFVVHTGGLAHGADAEDAYAQQFFGPARGLVAGRPVFVAPAASDAGANAFFRLFSLPGNERWYSFEIGPVHGTVLDAASDLGPESEQVQWLADDLAKASKPWKLVFVHAAPFPAGAQRGSGPMRRLAPLLEQMGVHLVFSGDGGYYLRSRPLGRGAAGVTYVVTGGRGPHPDVGDRLPAWGARLTMDRHFCWVEATRKRLRLQALAVTGGVLDCYEAEKPRQTAGEAFPLDRAIKDVASRAAQVGR